MRGKNSDLGKETRTLAAKWSRVPSGSRSSREGLDPPVPEAVYKKGCFIQNISTHGLSCNCYNPSFYKGPSYEKTPLFIRDPLMRKEALIPSSPHPLALFFLFNPLSFSTPLIHLLLALKETESEFVLLGTHGGDRSLKRKKRRLSTKRAFLGGKGNLVNQGELLLNS